jgi:hypothetical protein
MNLRRKLYRLLSVMGMVLSLPTSIPDREGGVSGIITAESPQRGMSEEM